MNRQIINRQPDRQTEREINRQTDRKADRVFTGQGVTRSSFHVVTAPFSSSKPAVTITKIPHKLYSVP